MDDQLRRAQRQAATGDPEAEIRYTQLCGRIGLYFRDHQPDETLSEAEEVQQDYDDIFWHRKSVIAFKWTGYCRCCYDYGSFFASGTVKAKDMKRRDNWGNNNAKRNTLRTHRDGSRKNYRLKNNLG